MAEERSHQGKILEEEKENAKDIWLEAIEKLSQTMKKKKETFNDPPKKSQRTSSKAISFLSEKKTNKQNMDLKRKELKLKSMKYERGRKRCDEAEKRHDSMMQMFVYQNQLMLSIISTLADKQCFLVLTCFHHWHFVLKFLLHKWWLYHLQWLTNSLKCCPLLHQFIKYNLGSK